MASAALTTKGQITIPVEVRQDLGLKPGDRVRFIKGDRGEYILRPQNRSIMDLFGAGKWAGPPVTIEEMNETIDRGWAGLLSEDED